MNTKGDGLKINYSLISLLAFIFIIPFYGGGKFNFVNVLFWIFLLFEVLFNFKRFRFINRSHVKTKVFWYFFLTCIVTSLFATDYFFSYLILKKYLVVFLSFIFLYNSIEKRNISIVFKTIGISASVELFFGLMQYLGFQKFEFRKELIADEVFVDTATDTLRAYGTFVHSLNFIAFILPVALSIATYFTVRKNYLYSCIAYLFTIMSIIISGSRGALVGFIVTNFILLTTYFFYSRNKKSKLYVLVAVTLVVIFILNILINYSNNPLLERFTSTDIKNIDRVDIAKSVTPIINDNIILGVGSGNVTYALNKYHTNWLNAPLNQNGHVENVYLTILISNGIFGLLFFLILIFVPIFKGLRYMKSYGFNNPFVTLSTIYFVCCAVLMISNPGLLNESILVTIVLYYVFLLKSIKQEIY